MSREAAPLGAQKKNKWNDAELCGIMRNAPGAEKIEGRRQELGAIWTYLQWAGRPILISRAGGILKRDTVTNQCLRGDSWV
jgi:hypothetical protein